MHFLQLNALHFAYPDRGEVVRDVGLQLAPGEIHCLIGRSGCGKTTVLKLAAGLLTPQQGQVQLKGQTVLQPTSDMGFVFQSPTLLHWLSVLDNVLLPLSLHGTVTNARRAHGEQLLAQMGLAALRHDKPHQLSGGQQSRVALARALITQPAVLFLDEPFAALDAITREDLQRDFLALCQAQGTAVLFVTHDMSEAVYLADQVSLMHEGRIQAPLHIDLPRPRQTAMRYTPAFNALCEQLRHAMDATL
ncbi:ABC transporter ATP-binding protein [Limnohabitans sp. Jir72]|uniref:ABC transporter ATP-binding protein n=1 Tax=Limnohabitans sp. Jir72 TaxID=1977909 RepID=UPI000D368943|nr:ABC transporter ATP-binding protein [Limnohabitans sp. Jir72]PUE36069.1 nitrate ABC transporter ATP-binding protein [Limnohabitans sp. Jir72]